MSFIFASSHLPELEHPADEDGDADDAPPMRHSGGVRAFSHLPQARHRQPRAEKNARAEAQPPLRQPNPGRAQDPAGMEKIQFDDAHPDFVEHVRKAMRAEAGESPTASSLLGQVGTLPNKIAVKRHDLGLSYTSTDKDGNVTVHVNPNKMTGATMSHEFGHVMQQAHAHNALQKTLDAGRTPTGAEIDAAIQAGRHALNQVAPVKDERDQSQEHKENEAMRLSNIVNAERTATGMKGLPEAQKTQEEFWYRQRKKQSDARHQNNALPMPEGSFYGKYPFNYVKQVLGYDANGRKPAPTARTPQP